MHIWRNPHHADEAALQEWKCRAGCFKVFLEWMRNRPALLQQTIAERCGRKSCTLSSLRKKTHRDVEPAGGPRRSIFIYSKIPKKIGARLEPDDGHAEEVQHGYGLLLEEKFKVHRLLFFILLLYFLVSMVLIIWMSRTGKFIKLPTFIEVTGMLAWILSFWSLLVTVWFKWAEN